MIGTKLGQTRIVHDNSIQSKHPKQCRTAPHDMFGHHFFGPFSRLLSVGNLKAIVGNERPHTNLAQQNGPMDIKHYK